MMPNMANNVDIPGNCWQQQRLPNELLLEIIKQFEFEQGELCCFLTVNKFFFEVALRFLMRDPFREWKMQLSAPCTNGTEWRNREVFLALVLRSAVQRMMLERQLELDQGGSNEYSVQDRAILMSPSQAVSMISYMDPEVILNEHGLTLGAYGGFTRQGLLSQWTTVDYSSYLATLNPLEIERIHWSLCLQDTKKASTSNGEGQDDVSLQTVPGRRKVRRVNACQNLIRLLLRRNHGRIVKLAFSLDESPYLLQFATRMPNLQELSINNTLSSSENQDYSKNAIEFIHKHYEAYPNKPSLKIHFSRPWLLRGGWKINQVHLDRPLWQRELLRYQTKVRLILDICEAIGQPHMLDASFLPGFYEEADAVGTGNLRKLVDAFAERLDAGEGPAMEAFLRRCHQLRKLTLEVGSPYLFRWAVQPKTATETGVGRLAMPVAASRACPRGADIGIIPHRPLPKLTKLSLGATVEHRFLIYALNDAVEAFGESLARIKVTANISKGENTPAFITKDRLVLTQELQDVPRATGVGFNWILPNVRKIQLSITRECSLGFFDQCPLLEELSIDCSMTLSWVVRFNRTSHSAMDKIREELESQPLELLPEWNMPRLRKLKLEGFAAVRFNFDSIKSMKKLEHLDIKAYEPGWDLFFANIYMTVCQDALQGASQSMEGLTISQGNGTRAAAYNKENLQDARQKSKFFPWKWASASITRLHIYGPFALMFHLEQFANFPNLRDLNLSAPDNSCYTFLSSMDQAMAMLYSVQTLEQRQGPQSYASKITTAGSLLLSEALTKVDHPNGVYGWTSFPDLYVPLESQLEKVNFGGSWKDIEVDIWVRLLARYAPRLKSLLPSKTQSGVRLVRAINEVDKIAQSMEKEEATYLSRQEESATSELPIMDKHNEVDKSTTKDAPGSRLKNVHIHERLSPDELREMDLEILPTKHNQQDVRMYYSISCGKRFIKRGTSLAIPSPPLN